MRKQGLGTKGPGTAPRFGRIVFKPGILREMDTVAALESQCQRICAEEEAKNRQGLMANRVLMRIEKHERDLTGIVKAMIPTLHAAGFVREERREA